MNSLLLLPVILSAALVGCAGQGITESVDVPLFGMPFISGCVYCKSATDYPYRSQLYYETGADRPTYSPGSRRQLQREINRTRVKLGLSPLY